MKNYILFICCVFSFQFLLAQSDSLNVKTMGIIVEINKKRTKKYVKEIATVSYTTENGLELESYLELVRVPFLGSFKNVGDEIEIYYNAQKPTLIETKTSSFIKQYGMYFLIVLGVVFSFKSLKDAYSQKP